MTEADDGKTEKPIVENARPCDGSCGTNAFPGSLRDWIAGQVLAGLFAAGDQIGMEDDAKFAYKMADAVLVERRKERAT